MKLFGQFCRAVSSLVATGFTSPQEAYQAHIEDLIATGQANIISPQRYVDLLAAHVRRGGDIAIMLPTYDTFARQQFVEIKAASSERLLLSDYGDTPMRIVLHKYPPNGMPRNMTGHVFCFVDGNQATFLMDNTSIAPVYLDLHGVLLDKGYNGAASALTDLLINSGESDADWHDSTFKHALLQDLKSNASPGYKLA